MTYEEAMDDILQQEESISKKILNGESKISNRVEIEDVLLEIKRMQKEADFLRELKKHRISPLDKKIKDNEQNVETLRTAILDCMKEKGDSKIDFPDVGKISTRKTPTSFEIEDQSKMEEHLDKLGLIKDVAEHIWKFDKKKLNKVFSELKENNNLPAGVKVIDSETSISISFDDKSDDKLRERERQVDASRWKKVDDKINSSQKTSSFDTLSVEI